MMAAAFDNSRVLDYLESELRRFIIRCISSVKNWENACLPQSVMKDASERRKRTQSIDNVLNKPDYTLMDYINFDAYMSIMTRRDNWRNYFESVFLEKIYSYIR